MRRYVENDADVAVLNRVDLPAQRVGSAVSDDRNFRADGDRRLLIVAGEDVRPREDVDFARNEITVRKGK